MRAEHMSATDFDRRRCRQQKHKNEHKSLRVERKRRSKEIPNEWANSGAANGWKQNGKLWTDES